MVRHARECGYVALMAVLIVGAISLTISLALLTSGADSQRSTLVTQRSTQARGLAVSCAEEGLQIIHDDTSYAGTGNLSLGQGSCTYVVANTGGSSRTIDATGTVGNVVRKVKVYVTITSSSISVTSWQEVPDA